MSLRHSRSRHVGPTCLPCPCRRDCPICVAPGDTPSLPLLLPTSRTRSSPRLPSQRRPATPAPSQTPLTAHAVPWLPDLTGRPRPALCPTGRTMPRPSSTDRADPIRDDVPPPASATPARPDCPLPPVPAHTDKPGSNSPPPSRPPTATSRLVPARSDCPPPPRSGQSDKPDRISPSPSDCPPPPAPRRPARPSQPRRLPGPSRPFAPHATIPTIPGSPRSRRLAASLPILPKRRTVPVRSIPRRLPFPVLPPGDEPALPRLARLTCPRRRRPHPRSTSQTSPSHPRPTNPRLPPHPDRPSLAQGRPHRRTSPCRAHPTARTMSHLLD